MMGLVWVCKAELKFQNFDLLTIRQAEEKVIACCLNCLTCKALGFLHETEPRSNLKVPNAGPGGPFSSTVLVV